MPTKPKPIPADLLDAQTTVDWAVAQLPSLSERMQAWLDENVYAVVEETEPPATHDVIVAIEKQALPLGFNVEVGSYLNVIRSSLDILATAIGRRYSVLHPNGVYFPVAESAEKFATGDYNGSKFINALPADAADIFKALRPYQGGNKALWSLHQLDVMRKHRRLLQVEIRPFRFGLAGLRPPGDDFQTIATGYLRANEKTVLGMLRKGAPYSNLKVYPHVALDEASAPGGKPVVQAINEFARLATTIIRLFA